MTETPTSSSDILEEDISGEVSPDDLSPAPAPVNLCVGDVVWARFDCQIWWPGKVGTELTLLCLVIIDILYSSDRQPDVAGQHQQGPGLLVLLHLHLSASSQQPEALPEQLRGTGRQQ